MDFTAWWRVLASFGVVRHSPYQLRIRVPPTSLSRIIKTYQPSNQGTSVFPHISAEKTF